LKRVVWRDLQPAPSGANIEICRSGFDSHANPLFLRTFAAAVSGFVDAAHAMLAPQQLRHGGGIGFPHAAGGGVAAT